MIRINGKQYPDRWEELTPEQYVAVVAAICTFQNGGCGFSGFRRAVTEAVIGPIPAEPANCILCENIFRISERLTFPYRYEYDDPRYAGLSEDVKRLLEKQLPEDLDMTDPQIRIAASFRMSVRPDLDFHRQMLPVLPSAPELKGYTFEVCDSLARTDMTAGQYVAANALLDVLLSGGDYFDEALNTLAATLYKGEGSNVAKLPFAEKMAVMFNYIAVTEFIARLQKYDLIFNRTAAGDNRKRRSPLGGEATLYTLVEKGYGDLATVEGMNLFAYLDVLLKQTIDCILQLKAIKKKPAEIAGELNLSPIQIESVS